MTINEECLRLAREIAEAGVGRLRNLPLFLQITEGRGSVPKYSWCGDFVTYVLQQAGIWDGRILNRVSINGVWAVGQNLARILRWGLDHDAFLKDYEGVMPGDIVMYANNRGDHCCVYAEMSKYGVVTYDGNAYNGHAGRRVRGKDVTLRGIIQTEKMPPCVFVPYTETTRDDGDVREAVFVQEEASDTIWSGEKR